MGIPGTSSSFPFTLLGSSVESDLHLFIWPRIREIELANSLGILSAVVRLDLTDLGLAAEGGTTGRSVIRDGRQGIESRLLGWFIEALRRPRRGLRGGSSHPSGSGSPALGVVNQSPEAPLSMPPGTLVGAWEAPMT